MIGLTRRALIAGLGSLPLMVSRRAHAQVVPDYVLRPERLSENIWIVRGADAPILSANGGAIANIGIVATPAGTVLIDAGPSMRYGVALKAVAEALTGKPVIRVYVSHLHPDHSFGLGPFSPSICAALPETIAEIERDGAGFSDGVYRLLGDWMRGTEIVLPAIRLSAGEEDFGGHKLRVLPLSGHSDADLCLLHEPSGTLFAGDLVFHDRAPATPDADLGLWRASLDALLAVPHGVLVPGHGPADPGGTAAIAQTRAWLDWLEAALRGAVAKGMDMVEAGELPIPDRFASLAAARYELQRSVSHFYPRFEAEMLPRIDTAG